MPEGGCGLSAVAFFFPFFFFSYGSGLSTFTPSLPGPRRSRHPRHSSLCWRGRSTLRHLARDWVSNQFPRKNKGSRHIRSRERCHSAATTRRVRLARIAAFSLRRFAYYIIILLRRARGSVKNNQFHLVKWVSPDVPRMNRRKP